MKIKSFIFGLGCGFMLLSVSFYFLYSYKVKDNVSDNNLQITNTEIVERAKQLGMVFITESLEQGTKSKLSDDEIINLAKNLGMVFLEEESLPTSELMQDSIEENDSLEYDEQEDDLVTADNGLDENVGEMVVDNTVAADKKSDTGVGKQNVSNGELSAGNVGADEFGGELASGNDGFNESVGTLNDKNKNKNENEVEVEDNKLVENNSEPIVENNVESVDDSTVALTGSDTENNDSEVASGNAVNMDNSLENKQEDLLTNEAVENNIENEFVVVDIKKGMSAKEISQKLYNSGIIADADNFLNFLKEHNVTKKIIFGTFYFYPGESYDSILEKMKL